MIRSLKNYLKLRREGNVMQCSVNMASLCIVACVVAYVTVTYIRWADTGLHETGSKWQVADKMSESSFRFLSKSRQCSGASIDQMLKNQTNDPKGLTIYSKKVVTQLKNYDMANCDIGEFKVKDEPWMKEVDKYLLRHHLRKRQNETGDCMNYVEWGSGGSTFWALNYADNLLSIENNPAWCEKIIEEPKIQCAIAAGKLVYVCVNGGKVGRLGKPQKKPLYRSELYINVLQHFNITPDFVLDDGRYRAAVAMNVLPVLKSDSVLMIHDYNNRKQYWEVELFYDKINKKSSEFAFFGVFQKKKSINQTLVNEKLQLYRQKSD